MAQYGFNIDTLSRLKGGSAIQTLAYLTRGKLFDEYSDKTFDYSNKKDFVHYEVSLPDNAPPGFNDAVLLCTEIEKAEKRYDARIGRTSWLSLPNDKEVSPNEWIGMVREFVDEAFVSLGMCVIWAIHYSKHPDDPSKDNPNAHIFLTDRPIDREGFCAKKDRTWNNKKHVRVWRKMWADVQNRMLELNGLEKVSHESLEVQGIEREPTIPLGRASIEMELRDIQTERGNRNRAIAARNQEHKEQLENLNQQKRNKKRNRSRER